MLKTYFELEKKRSANHFEFPPDIYSLFMTTASKSSLRQQFEMCYIFLLDFPEHEVKGAKFYTLEVSEPFH